MTRLWFLNDIIFKFVFGSEGNEPALRALLNALLGFSGDHRIADLKLLNPDLTREHIIDKNVILDIRARDQAGRHYNIEVQIQSQTAYAKRALYYLARLYGGQLESGGSYKDLCRTIGISLLDFRLFEHNDLHSIYRMYDTAHQTGLEDALEIVCFPQFHLEAEPSP